MVVLYERLVLLCSFSLILSPIESFQTALPQTSFPLIRSQQPIRSIDRPGLSYLRTRETFSSPSLGSAAVAEDWDLRQTCENGSRQNSIQKPFVLLPPPKQCIKITDKYTERIQEWANVYTSVESLRKRFGANQNKLWGDLDAETARRLYKTLLPRSLLLLAQTGVKPQDLAPLAYQARVAAKLYIRERSRVPPRIVANMFDGIRQFRQYGRFNTRGMSYDQIWEKYRKIILDDCQTEGSCVGLTEEDVVAQICSKILEKSCSSNQYVDRLFASSQDYELGEELRQISDILESDAHRLVDPILSNSLPSNHQIKRYQTLRRVARAKQLLLGSPLKKRRKAR